MYKYSEDKRSKDLFPDEAYEENHNPSISERIEMKCEAIRKATKGKVITTRTTSTSLSL